MWIFVLLAAFAFVGPATAGELKGSARVIDGNTIEIAGQPQRLYGMDAPDLRQTCVDGGGNNYPCGAKAAEALRDIIGETPVRCRETVRKGQETVLATCHAGDVNVNAEMVLRGWAVADSEETDLYAGHESRAMDNHSGLWIGEFIPPGNWRRKYGGGR